MIRDVVTSLLLLAGTALMLLAAVGILRMPDVYTRLSATSKAATLGVALLLLGGAAYFPHPALADRALATVVFFLLTAPVGAHVIGRAAYHAGVEPAGVEVDEYAPAVCEEELSTED